MKISTSVEKTMKEIKDIYTFKKQRGSPVVTGFPSLDKIMGFYPEFLTVVAGTLVMEKTGFCLSVALNVALIQNKKVAIFSLHYSAKDITIFLLSQQSHVARDHISYAYMGKDERLRLEDASSKISKAPIFIYDYPFLTIEQLWKMSGNIVKENQIDLLIIDGFQHINSINSELDRHLWLLHRLTNELHIPIIIGIDIPFPDRKNLRPNLGDLKKWGIDNYHPENIIFLYPKNNYESSLNEVVELIVYSGSQLLPKVKLKFMPEYMTFNETQINLNVKEK